LLGEAYQVADDIRDATSTEGELGKPVGRDAALGRPTAVNHLGLGGAVAHLDRLIDRALQAVPACPGQVPFREKVRAEVRWFVPKDHAQFAA
jgi:geranylgeranyl diphosphate synthase type II